MLGVTYYALEAVVYAITYSKGNVGAGWTIILDILGVILFFLQMHFIFENSKVRIMKPSDLLLTCRCHFTVPIR